MGQATGVVFPEVGTARIEEFEIDGSHLGSREILVATETSLISPGTEGAFFGGSIANAPAIYAEVAAHNGPAWVPENAPYPARTGYANVGRVLAVGSTVDDSLVGKRVFTMSRHASLVVCDTDFFHCPVPESVDPRHAVFSRFAGVGITALRAAEAAAGDKVAVIGLGLVGNLAAQLLQVAGCDVVTFDPDPKRREMARLCGIASVHDPATEHPIAATRQWAGDGGPGSGADIVVEATGRSDLVEQASEMAGLHGKIVLLGSPRRPHAMDVTPLLARVHWLAQSVLGGLEWRFPVAAQTPRARFTMERNYRDIMGWIADGRLRVEPLITDVLPPEDCQAAFSGLRDHPDAHVGVIFDWTGATTTRS
jgi:2-desacetyl-2-hydroxyethyl bacteriochlorophyllide A dehydrogenase